MTRTAPAVSKTSHHRSEVSYRSTRTTRRAYSRAARRAARLALRDPKGI